MTKEQITEQIKKKLIAHRGLHDNQGDAPENSLKAFQRAVDAGYGIELDLHLSKDGKVVVIHDGELDRVAGTHALVRDLTAEQLQRYQLFSSEQTIPLFTDVLKIVAEKVPMVVELKVDTPNQYSQLCAAFDHIIKEYQGIYCIESFCPDVLKWYKKHRPDVVRGQLSCDMGRGTGIVDRFRRFRLTNMWANLYTKPDFIAYEYRQADKKCVQYWKKHLHCTMAAWTIRSQEAFEQAKPDFDIFIFDSFIPQA